MAIEFTAGRYIGAVLGGDQVACRWVQLACERHQRDLESGRARGLYFDETAAKVAIAFFAMLKHSKGEWAGQPVKLEPWQQFHLWVLFGWKRADRTRRFRTSYLEVARKNGKSTLAAGVGLYLLVADSEPGAEIYTAATKRDQARIIHGEAVRMVQQSLALQREVRIVKDNIHSTRTFSKYEPLGRDADSLDGLNVHGALIDELHAHPNGDMWDILETATSARRQPLMYAITTSGSDRQSICYQLHQYTRKVLEGTVEDDSHYGVIYSLDNEAAADGISEGPVESWENEAAWIKANPNLGVSKKLDNLRDKAHKAKGMPARLSAFLQKELNVWVQGESRWVLPEKWRACDHGAVPSSVLLGRPCWGALDLASTLDICAWLIVFEPVEGIRPLLCRFFLPEENLMARVRNDRVPYDAWQRAGYLTLTPGNVVDYDFILEQVREDLGLHKVREIAFDPWNATHVSNKLIEDGVVMVEFRQGYVSMNPAVKALEVAIQQRTFNHAGNPVLAWMADNVIMTSDPAGNRKPDKSKSREKIDGIVALLMAYYRATLGVGKSSVYEGRGLRTI